MKTINTFRLVFYLLFSISMQAQDTLVDSLKHELSIHTQKDTKRVDLLILLAYNYRRHNISIAEEKSIEANSLAKELAYEKGLAKSVLVFSKIHISKSEYNEALEDALESLKLYKKIKSDNYKDVNAVYNTLGMISNYQNAPDKSLEYFKQALFFAKEHDDLKRESASLCNIGVIYFSKGEFDDAIHYYKQSIAIDEKLGSVKASLTALSNLAVIFSIQGRYGEALAYHNKILEIYREDNKNDKIASTLQNIGIVYSDIDQDQKAYTYFEESLQIHKKLEAKRGIAINLSSIGTVLVNLKEYKKGLKYLNEALSINKEVNNNESLIPNHNATGKVHLILEEPKLALSHFKSSLSLSLYTDDKRNIGAAHVNLAEAYLMLKNYPKALHHAVEGKQLVDNLDILPGQKEVNIILSKIYEATGAFEKSLNHFKQYKALNDSLFNKENIQKITELEYEYKYKQELELASLRESKLTETVNATSQDLEESQRNLLLGVIASLLMILVLGTIIFFLKLRNAKSKTQNIAIEQKFLRSQMTPHFIFNSLSVLQGMILNKEDKKAVLYLSKFSKLLRITLENSRDKMVPLRQELAAMENYLDLQNLEVHQPYEYTVLVDETIDTSVFEIPPMLIQPFIENSIEHGFKNKNENKKIDIQLKYSNKELICTITDNGIGIDAQKENQKVDKKSLATTITSERLKMLSKDFKIKGAIKIEDRQKYKEQGTLVTLVIPYKTQLAK